MKASALKAAIRKLDNAPLIRFNLAGKLEVNLPVQKGALCNEIDRLFGSPSAETGLWLRADGYIMREEDRA